MMTKEDGYMPYWANIIVLEAISGDGRRGAGNIFMIFMYYMYYMYYMYLHMGVYTYMMYYQWYLSAFYYSLWFTTHTAINVYA